MMEFRAGKMIADGKTVVADTRRGLVRITRGEEGFVHFQCLDRMQNVVEHVLRTGQIDLMQFGIDPSKYKFTVTTFLEALEDFVSVASQAEDDWCSISQSRNPKDSMDESH